MKGPDNSGHRAPGRQAPPDQPGRFIWQLVGVLDT